MRTDGNDEANKRVSQFCERAQIGVQVSLALRDLTLRVFELRDDFSERINRVKRGIPVFL
jgi:antitoxin (DNA-binding transcriptional repressor) of toxin-antitoxin stability system